MKKKHIYRLISIIVLLALGIWCKSRWKVWFGNPPEQPYTTAGVPSRMLLTFGNEGELSRYVSWMCDTIVHQDACLFLTDTLTTDTLQIGAVGEVFRSRAGQSAFYRAEMTKLMPNRIYKYAVKTNDILSKWYQFTTADPLSKEFSFLFVGDVQDSINGITNKILCQALNQHPEVEFIVFGGDLTERPTDDYWQETFRGIDSICTTLPILNINGNHEYLKYAVRQCERRNSLVFPYFLRGMEQRDDKNHIFAFQYHNTMFMLLDTNRELPFLLQQRNWLQQQLETSTSPHKIVICHHPIYSVKRPNNNILQRWSFRGPIEDAKVDLVLQGHEHVYARCTRLSDAKTNALCDNPPLYTVSHCSPKTYQVHPDRRFDRVISGSRYYQLITVKNDTMFNKAIDVDTQEVIDSVAIIQK